jgi:hypothetical protein
MKKLLSIICMLLSIHAVAYELSQPNLNLMDTRYLLQTFALGADLIRWNSELNMYEKQSDGSILIPIIGQKDGKNTTLAWVRLSCSDNNILALEGFNNGSFSTTKNSNGNDVAASIKQYYCPIITDEGKKLLAYGSIISPDGKTYSYLGWYPEEMSLNANREILVKLYGYVKTDANKYATKNVDEAVINCPSKTLALNNVAALSVDSGRKDMRFLLNTACQFNDVLKMSAINIPINLNKANSKPDIDEAKLKCKAKGLKEKTEKFGLCVLENLN